MAERKSLAHKAEGKINGHRPTAVLNRSAAFIHSERFGWCDEPLLSSLLEVVFVAVANDRLVFIEFNRRGQPCLFPVVRVGEREKERE